MAHTFYDGTIPVVQSILNSLSHILQQASQQPNANILLAARLHEDMYPLTDQVRITTQFAANLVARLTGQSPVSFEGSPATYVECHERIETVLKALKDADKEVVNQHADVVASTPMGPETAVEMSAAAYAHRIALPNIYFHLTTAYGILRKEGVPLERESD
ncbi:hypothetical protein ABOM_004416 [Aspergillus bombycis]|uniref:DUF1993 domain protein n=1 Tax=Aspergillus bombycis TaxID=109264 RepID=A0A1F8A5C5_9EURO|nr:hypothetical protein ABOM_004416 [Aspergillus bombycis]OGM46942.1 hypothetical protein ABOM_004416 [Aspergillus bombycis]